MTQRKPDIITAAIAAFGAAGRLDKGAYLNYLHRLRPYVDGVLIPGTTAEFPSLTDDERTKLVSWTLTVFETSRIIAQIGAPSTMQALRLMDMASDSGATRFAAITPYYLPATESGILRYYSLLRANTSYPLYAYIFPDVTGNDVSTGTIRRLASLGINGLKLSGTASTRVAIYHRAAPSLSIWSGNDADLPATCAAGGAGVVSGISGAFPDAWAALRDALIRHDDSTASFIQRALIAIVQTIGPTIGNLKYALRILGESVGTCRMPIDEPDESTRLRIRELVSSMRAGNPWSDYLRRHDNTRA
jgi:4-hydroxy-tetrahydrodipicolinate synthase